ncbi:hypothetical protein [Mycobacterium avium]|uniref:hypothetical protein n=1 Tax=Mycobacterium avium TaxID=1764 RepID=UPI000A7A7639|nr:hypothetical protein [Mycobacterium avium]MDO2351649.1 hypothetical protein [Mycobacterium avium subsp. hominissuis]MDV3219602.1 hypothetical protein [Mycobacterium avium]
MTARTMDQLIEATGLDVLTELDRQLEIPLLSGVQRQGDVLVRPANVVATTPVPSSGTPVVRGENGGNTHAIQADGEVYCDVLDPSPRNLAVARLTVKSGEAVLCHPEHGFNRIAPGSYEIRRQREMAEEIRMVAD